MQNDYLRSGTGESPQSKPRILNVRFAASEYPGAENCLWFKATMDRKTAYKKRRKREWI
jgi:hypothetical protein